MGAGDVVVPAQGLAYAYRYSFFSTVQVSQAGDPGGDIKLIDMLFENADGEHLLVHLQPTGLPGIAGGYLCIDRFRCFGLRHTVLQKEYYLEIHPANALRASAAHSGRMQGITCLYLTCGPVPYRQSRNRASPIPSRAQP